ncbi:FAD-dependent monooxygenase [Actinomadura sp. DC4]|uniref:FAD-dependent monooxygenase n=1 Tax=Actinomadura sp. DC4 TaxID=3055069 RepID=UPI0025AFC86E|nr:FAD-dependent monooxygenase [Actinomadura sp. DC4]MDN3355683.1 FAD-binding protein [Actinomadura sp. DC4]
MSRPTHAVVMGGGLAGMLTAHVLARHAGSVTVVERDVLPDGPEHRRGVPQAHHAHLLWSNGARVIDELLPGTTGRLLGAGARRIGFQGDQVTLTVRGWQHRFPPTQFAILCTRPLLDWTIRDQVLSAGRISVHQGAEVVDLCGDGGRVTGVRVRDADSGETTTVEADLVADATGRASGLRHWLSSLGVAPPEKDVVDAGIGYATRLFAAPPGATTAFPAVNVGAFHREGEPGHFGVVYPVEGDRWLVTLSCTRGGTLPAHEDEFQAFAQTRLGHPLVADLIGSAEPLTPVFRSHSGANRRLYPERHDGWPEGLIVVGDSLTAFNPVYGHGMSAAARCAAALDRELASGGTTRRMQEAIGAAVDDPWILAASKDVGYVNCRIDATDPRLIGEHTVQQRRFADSIIDKSLGSPGVCEVVTDVISLSAGPAELGSSNFLALMAREKPYPKLTGPPLRSDELDIVRLRAYESVPTA